MDWWTQWVWHNGKFLGIEWHAWKVVGWLGNLLFTSRFFVQWWATERQKRVVVPSLFWYLSLAGSSCLLAYGVHKRDSVFIFAYVFTWIPYIRNLVIGQRVKRSQTACAGCGEPCAREFKFCPHCGAKLTAT